MDSLWISILEANLQVLLSWRRVLSKARVRILEYKNTQLRGENSWQMWIFVGSKVTTSKIKWDWKAYNIHIVKIITLSRLIGLLSIGCQTPISNPEQSRFSMKRLFRCFHQLPQKGETSGLQAFTRILFPMHWSLPPLDTFGWLDGVGPKKPYGALRLWQEGTEMWKRSLVVRGLLNPCIGKWAPS